MTLHEAVHAALSPLNAEEYYRTMFRGGTQSWNLRDQHMAGTIEALRDHLSGADRLHDSTRDGDGGFRLRRAARVEADTFPTGV